ncbi:hypothetical protein [Sodalis praecaptivus]
MKTFPVASKGAERSDIKLWRAVWQLAHVTVSSLWMGYGVQRNAA